MKTSALLAPLVLCLALGACDDTATSVVCPAEPGPSLLISVVDAVSGESVAPEASGWWTSGAVSDSLRHVSAQAQAGVTLLAAYGPPGLYDVRVQRPGRMDWVRTGIQVPPGTCGPVRTELTAQVIASSE